LNLFGAIVRSSSVPTLRSVLTINIEENVYRGLMGRRGTDRSDPGQHLGERCPQHRQASLAYTGDFLSIWVVQCRFQLLKGLEMERFVETPTPGIAQKTSCGSPDPRRRSR
jgi:hypothetical protein